MNRGLTPFITGLGLKTTNNGDSMAKSDFFSTFRHTIATFLKIISIFAALFVIKSVVLCTLFVGKSVVFRLLFVGKSVPTYRLFVNKSVVKIWKGLYIKNL